MVSSTLTILLLASVCQPTPVRDSANDPQFDHKTPAVIEGVMFEYWGEFEQKPFREEVGIQFIEDACRLWSQNAETADIIRRSEQLPIDAKSLPNKWKSMLLKQADGRYRERLELGMVPGAQKKLKETVRDRSGDMMYMADSQQADFCLGSFYGFTAPFELMPPLLKSDAKTITRTDDGYARHSLEVRGMEIGTIDVDTSNHDTIVRAIHRPAGAYRRFGGYRSCDLATGGMFHYPTFFAHLTAKDGHVDTIELYLVKSARFPEKLDDKEFAVPLPKATTGVLFAPGRPDKALATVRIKEPLDDARDLQPQLVQAAESRKQRGNDRD